MPRFIPKKILALAAALLTICSLTPSEADAGPRLDRIMKDKVLRVGTPGDYLPFALKEKDGPYIGHHVDVINEMVKIYGWKIEWVPTSWPTLTKDFQADKFDVALGGLARTPARLVIAEMLPPYAPFGKVALTRKELKDRIVSVESMNQPDIRVIKNPGGTNEIFVDTYLTRAKVTLHKNNHEIPQMIAEGKGDIMITENDEARAWCRKFPQLHAAFMDHFLTPVNFKGFMLQKDDPDYVRVMNYMWNLVELRGTLESINTKWLK